MERDDQFVRKVELLTAAGGGGRVRLVDGPAEGRTVPPESKRHSLWHEDVVKLGVLPSGASLHEYHLWVEQVARREDGRYSGKVAQWSMAWDGHGLTYGSAIDFGPEHVLDVANHEWEPEYQGRLQRCRHCLSPFGPIRPGSTTCDSCTQAVMSEWRLIVRECLDQVLSLDRHQLELRRRLHRLDPDVVAMVLSDLLAHRLEHPRATADEIIDLASECGLCGYDLDRLPPLGLHHGDGSSWQTPGFLDLEAVQSARAGAADRVTTCPDDQGDLGKGSKEAPIDSNWAVEDGAVLEQAVREFERQVNRRGGTA